MTCVYKYMCHVVYSTYTHDRDFESITTCTLLMEPVNERVAQPSSVPLPCNSCPLCFRRTSYTCTVDRVLVSESIYCWCDPKGTLPFLVQLNRYQVSSINAVIKWSTSEPQNEFCRPTPPSVLMLASYAYGGGATSERNPIRGPLHKISGKYIRILSLATFPSSYLRKLPRFCFLISCNRY